MFCINCGKELQNDAKFCASCGKKIEDSEKDNLSFDRDDDLINMKPNNNSDTKKDINDNDLNLYNKSSEKLNKQLAISITNVLENELSQFSFNERHDNVTNNLVGIVKKKWNPLKRLSGDHGITAIISVPKTITSPNELKTFFKGIKSEIGSRFVPFGSYKSTYSFFVLICPHNLFISSPGIATKLKDKTGLKMNIIKGVILVDEETKDVTGSYSSFSLDKNKYDTILSATKRAIK